MRVRAEHQQMLLDMCEKNPELISNKFNGPQGKARGHALWQTVAQKLNSLGFGEKSQEEWRKALTDWKCKTKAKAAKFKLEIQKTGGGPATFTPLSDLEKRLIELMGTRAVDGDEVPELGFGKVTIIPVVPSEETKISEFHNPLYEHDYLEKENIQIGNMDQPTLLQKPDTSSTSLVSSAPIKRKFNKQTPTSKPYRRVTPKQTERLSNKLISINQESLQILKTISENTTSIANSLQNMTEILQRVFHRA